MSEKGFRQRYVENRDALSKSASTNGDLAWGNTFGLTTIILAVPLELLGFMVSSWLDVNQNIQKVSAIAIMVFVYFVALRRASARAAAVRRAREGTNSNRGE